MANTLLPSRVALSPSFKINNGVLDLNHLVVPATQSYTEIVSSGDKTVLCDASSGAIIITLPSTINNHARLDFKKIDATGNSVTLSPILNQTIDGQANFQFNTQYEAISLISDGKNWYIV